MNPDIVNGVFEFAGSLLLWRNVLQLHRDKETKGVHWGATCFFMLWGYWNLFYYPSLDQMWSFWGGVSIVIANTVWFAQMMYYRMPAGGRVPGAMECPKPPLQGECVIPQPKPERRSWRDRPGTNPDPTYPKPLAPLNPPPAPLRYRRLWW